MKNQAPIEETHLSPLGACGAKPWRRAGSLRLGILKQRRDEAAPGGASPVSPCFSIPRRISYAANLHQKRNTLRCAGWCSFLASGSCSDIFAFLSSLARQTSEAFAGRKRRNSCQSAVFAVKRKRNGDRNFFAGAPEGTRTHTHKAREPKSRMSTNSITGAYTIVPGLNLSFIIA